MAAAKSKWIELFEGLAKEVISFDDDGFILSARFDTASDYTIIEIIGFRNVKNILPAGDGITFQSDGHKIFVLYEPKGYRFRFQEPYLRDEDFQIPMRWNELTTIDLPNRDRVHVTIKPYMSYGSFSVERPETGNFVYYFFDGDQFNANMEHFLSTVFRKDLKIPAIQSKEIIKHIFSNLDVFRKGKD